MAWFIGLENQQVCYWHLADMLTAVMDVCFWGKADVGLLTHLDL